VTVMIRHGGRDRHVRHECAPALRHDPHERLRTTHGLDVIPRKNRKTRGQTTPARPLRWARLVMILSMKLSLVFSDLSSMKLGLLFADAPDAIPAC